MTHDLPNSINISASELISNEVLEQYYDAQRISEVLTTVLDYFDSPSFNNQSLNNQSFDNPSLNNQSFDQQPRDEHHQTNVVSTLPYFAELDNQVWQSKPKQLDIYITDIDEGRALNSDARGKNYATNILSYPSDLPPFILLEMPSIALGELIICHDVVVSQAGEQHKTVENHLTHLLVHGILHLLGFDHELGQAEQDEMEGFEIEILKSLNISNPYEG